MYGAFEWVYSENKRSTGVNLRSSFIWEQAEEASGEKTEKEGTKRMKSPKSVCHRCQEKREYQET